MMVPSNLSPLADPSPFSRGLEANGIVWQGRYQYLVASSSSLRYDAINTTLDFVSNETSRSWPPCYNCYRDEIRVPFLGDDDDSLALSIISDSSYYLNLDLIRDGGSWTRGLLGFTGGFSYFVAPDGYDGWSCDSVTIELKDFDSGAVGGTWIATDLVVGNHQEQGYCPHPNRIYRPCKDDEICTIVNRQQGCTFGGDEAQDRHAKLLESFECPEEVPRGAPPTLWLGPFSRESEGSIRFYQRHTFLQADSYEFIILDGTSDATHTKVEFPSWPRGFSEISDTDYEIFNLWNDEGTERRFSMQFERKQYGPRLTSRDGWDLKQSWVYDNLPDWTEWNAGRNETDIQVPTGYSLFACERVEFDYSSTYTGGSPARIVFKNFLLGAHFQRNYNVCHPASMPIYHPCQPTETCLAKNGAVACIPIGGNGDDVSVARSRGAVTDPSDLAAADPFRVWLDCVPFKDDAWRENNDVIDNSGAVSGLIFPFVTTFIISTLLTLLD